MNRVYMNLPDHAPASLHESDVVAQLLPTAIQILQNDFHLSGIECYLINFQGDVFHLRTSIAPLVERTGGPGSETFYRLLYRVDIPESNVTEALLKNGDTPISVIISELLIIRALQKAYYRLKFT
jgi:hypothetical protein